MNRDFERGRFISFLSIRVRDRSKRWPVPTLRWSPEKSARNPWPLSTSISPSLPYGVRAKEISPSFWNEGNRLPFIADLTTVFYRKCRSVSIVWCALRLWLDKYTLIAHKIGVRLADRRLALGMVQEVNCILGVGRFTSFLLIFQVTAFNSAR